MALGFHPCPLTHVSPAIPEALGADTGVAVHRIHALGPMAALVGHTVIVVCLAELPAVAGETVTPGTQAEGQCSTGPALWWLSGFPSPNDSTRVDSSPGLRGSP